MARPRATGFAGFAGFGMGAGGFGALLFRTWPLWAVDAACMLFGLWTLVCHLVVFTGGLPVDLTRATGIALTLGLLGLGFAARRWGLSALLHTLFDLDLSPSTRAAGINAGAVEALAARLPAWLRIVTLLFAVPALIAWARGGSLSLLWASAMVLALLQVGFQLLEPRRPPGLLDSPAPPSAVARILLAITALALAYVGLRLSRPDSDESFYQALGTSLQRFPHLPVLGFDAQHGQPTWPLLPAPYRVHSFELLCGFLGGLLGMWPIRVAHQLLPALAAALWPLALYRLTRELLPRGMDRGGVLAILVVLGSLAICLADGSTHTGYGNFSLLRLFQGKAIFLSVAVPLLLSYGLRFGRSPSWPRGLRLVLAQVTAIGLTASALPLSPLLGVAAVMAGMAASPAMVRLRTAVLGLLACLYPVGLGLVVSGVVVSGVVVSGVLQRKASAGVVAASSLGRAVARTAETAGAGVLDGWIARWTEGMAPIVSATARVLGPQPMALAYLAAVLLAPAFLPLRAARLAGWLSALFFLGLANPWLLPLVNRFALSPGIFFRAYWLLPLPLFLALALFALVDLWPAHGGALRYGRRPPDGPAGEHADGKTRGAPLTASTTRRHVARVGALLVGLVGLSTLLYHGPTKPTWSPDNHVQAPFWGLKVPPHFALTRAAARLLPNGGGVVWLPTEQNRFLTAMPEPAFPTFTKASYLPRAQKPLRILLARCADARRRTPMCTAKAIEQALRALDVQVAAVFRGNPQRSAIEAALRAVNFSQRQALFGYGLWARAGVPANNKLVDTNRE